MRRTDSQPSFVDLEFERQGVQLDPILARISEFLDAHGELINRVHDDLVRHLKRPKTGRRGLSAEQVIRAFVLWRIKGWPYRELRERIADGHTLRQFTRFGARAVPKPDAFQRSFSRLRPGTVRELNDAVVRAAVELKLEDGTKLRVDTTVMESDVHYPTDSTLLWDGVRTISRLVLDKLAPRLAEAVEGFADRRRRARRRMQEISRMRDRRGRHERAWRRKYRDLLKVSEAAVAGGRAVADRAERIPVADFMAQAIIDAVCGEIRHYCSLTERVIDQTRRRVLAGEVVPAEQKLYSIFEPHTDLIKRGKKRKPVEFGHKVFLAESHIGLITDYRVLDGNPVDSENVEPSLERHRELFERAPKLYAADRGFDHPDTRRLAEKAGVGALCIPQRGGKLTPERAAEQRSRRFKAGQRYRVGIEGTISVLQRGRGAKRCPLEGRERFELFLGAAVLANNLMRIAALLEKRRPRTAAARAA